MRYKLLRRTLSILLGKWKLSEDMKRELTKVKNGSKHRKIFKLIRNQNIQIK